MIETTLRDPDRVTSGLQRELELYKEQSGRRADRIAIIEAELVTLRRKLKRVIEDKAGEERESESWPIYVEKQHEYDRLIGKYERELEAVRAERTEGLYASKAEAFRVALCEVSAGLEYLREAPPADRLDFYRKIGLHGEIRLAGATDDQRTMKIGRHHYAIDFHARIDLLPPSACQSDKSLVNL
jgi:hypothetical protein